MKMRRQRPEFTRGSLLPSISMGIKFLCPNGHKMNVKAFLAGKRGKCPKCGASVRIPQETPASDSGEDLLGDPAEPTSAPSPAVAVSVAPSSAATAYAAP